MDLRCIEKDSHKLVGDNYRKVEVWLETYTSLKYQLKVHINKSASPSNWWQLYLMIPYLEKNILKRLAF